jgi:molybdopterin converting factor small subunit
MKICVRFVGWPASLFGKSYVWLFFENSPIILRKLLEKLELETGIKINLKDPNLVVLINGKLAEFIGGFNATLKDMDEVVITSISGGG